MEDGKRWIVTYTKHIKQKRKVYQDGALEHQGNKVVLYDDTGTVIDTRFLKKDEVIGSGETLTFNCYLVDIGDPEGNHGPIKDNKPVEKISTYNGIKKVDAGSIAVKKFVEKICTSHGLKRVDVGYIGTPRLNVLKNIKKENTSEDRKETHNNRKFRSPQIHPKATKINEKGTKEYRPQNSETSRNRSSSTQTTTREWHVTYTTQLTQKAKKYHDGFIRLELCGSHQQVLLYDTLRRLLDSRFLKKDEVVRSGDTLVFDAHLVDVGDPGAGSLDSTPLVAPKREDASAGAGAGPVKTLGERITMQYDLNNSSLEKKSELEIVEAQRDGSSLINDNIREWHALYTTQVTQKAKKYHDGTLQLAFFVSQRKQVTLLHEDGSILCKKYLNTSEDVRSGCTLQLPNYLVEITEPKSSKQGGLCKDASSGKIAGENSSRLIVDKNNSLSGARKKFLHVGLGPKADISTGKHVDANSSSSAVDNSKVSLSDARNGLMHNGSSHGQFKNDTSSGTSVAADSSNFSVEKISFAPAGVRNKSPRDVHQILFTLKRPMAPESVASKEKPPAEMIGSLRSTNFLQFDLEEKLLGQNIPDLTPSKRNYVGNPEKNFGKFDEDDNSQMSSYKSGMAQSNARHYLPTPEIPDLIDLAHWDATKENHKSCSIDILTSKSDEGKPDKVRENSYSSIKEPQDSESRLDISISSVLPESDITNNATTRSGSKSSSEFKDVKEEILNQVCAEKMGIATGLRGGSLLGFSSNIDAALVDAALDCSDDVEIESSQGLKSIPEEKMEMDEFPSFDLGF